MKGTYQIANSRIFIFGNHQTVKDVKLEIFAFLRPLLPSFKGTSVQRKKGMTDEDYERA